MWRRTILNCFSELSILFFGLDSGLFGVILASDFVQARFVAAELVQHFKDKGVVSIVLRALDVEPPSLCLSPELFEHLVSKLFLGEVFGVSKNLSDLFTFVIVKAEGSIFEFLQGPNDLGWSGLELGFADWANRVYDVADI